MPRKNDLKQLFPDQLNSDSPPSPPSTQEEKLRAKTRALVYEDCSFFSRMTLYWLTPLMKLGKSHNLHPDDIPQAPKTCQVASAYPRLLYWWLLSIGRKQKTMVGALGDEIQDGKNSGANFLKPFKTLADYDQRVRIGPAIAPTDATMIDDGFVERHPAVAVILQKKGGVEDEEESSKISVPPALHSNYSHFSDEFDSPAPLPIITAGSSLVQPTIKELEEEKLAKKEQYPNLFILLYLTTLGPLLVSVVMEMCCYGSAFLQPWAVRRLSKFFAEHEKDQSSTTFLNGAKWALLLSLSSTINTFAQCIKNQTQVEVAARQGAALFAALFEKPVRLAAWALSTDGPLNTGSLTNMINQDIQKVYFTPVFIHFPWSAPLSILICHILMYLDLGPAALVCATMMFILLPYQFLMAAIQKRARSKVLKLTDQRIKFVTQILSGIRVIKAYAWEEALGAQIEDLRKLELAAQWKVSLLVWINEVLVVYCYPIVVTFLTIASFVWFGGSLSPEVVYSILTYLNLIKSPIQHMALAISVIMDMVVSMDRMSMLFAKEEVPMFEQEAREMIKLQENSLRLLHTKAASISLSQEFPNGVDQMNHDVASLDALGAQDDPFSIEIQPSSLPPPLSLPLPLSLPPQPLVSLHHVDFYWASLDKKPMQIPVLADISLELWPKELLILISDSAVGKTALLTGLLGNLYPQPHKTFQGLPSIENLCANSDGGAFSMANRIEIVPDTLMQVSSSCGYCPQSPFLMNNTIRNNIILSSDFDQERFQRCIDAAALGPDLVILPQGDLTIVSAESGLSGGQQARVAFCRILYHADDIKVAVLDDIFAAVDAFVAKTMFFKGVKGILLEKGCGVLLALNSHYDFLHEATKTIYLAPSSDPFWYSLHVQLCSRRLEYQMNQEAAIMAQTTTQLNPFPNQPTRLLDLPQSLERKLPDGIENTATKKEAENQTDIFSKNFKTETQTLTDLSSPNPLFPNEELRPSLAHAPSQNTDSVGFRQPSGIHYFGNVEGLLGLGVPLVRSISLSTKSSILSNSNSNSNSNFNSNSKTDVSQSQSQGQIQSSHNDSDSAGGGDVQSKWVEKLKREELENEKLSKQIGKVTDEKSLKAASAQLDQKIEGSKPSTSSNVPAQAHLPWGLYLDYIQGAKSRRAMWIVFVFTVLVVIASQVFRTGLDIWLLEWAKDTASGASHPQSQSQSHSTKWWIVTSLIALLIMLGLGAIQIVLFLNISLQASFLFHATTIRKIFHGTLSWLDTTPMGTIVNALTRDVTTLDSALPVSLVALSQSVSSLVAVVVLSLISSPIFILPLLPCLFLIWWFRTSFHNTSVQLRRLETAAAAPVHSSFAALLKGAPVLRAFPLKILQSFLTQSHILINNLQRVMTISNLAERRFTFALNIVSSLYIALLSFCTVLFRDHINSSLSLLSITYGLKLTGSLQLALRIITNSTQGMTSVQRLKLFQENTPQEPGFGLESDQIAQKYLSEKQPLEFKHHQCKALSHHLITAATKPRFCVADDGVTQIDTYAKFEEHQKLFYWPWRGQIEFKDITLRYRPELPIVLHKCSFTIQPGQKVGLVAPTGAGKSTILLALMRMIDPEGGAVLIDDVDIIKICPGDLRSRLGLIPQLPTIFSGTVRTNLDPLSRYTDKEIWKALDLVSMTDQIQNLSNGLYSPVLENGSNFSSSERQLLSIARTLLTQPLVDKKMDGSGDLGDVGDVGDVEFDGPQQGSILLADEMTSMMSALSDNLVQSTIRSAFSHSTILIIAHRLASVVDLDRIIVLRRMTQELIEQSIGSVAEIEIPFVLLNNPESRFFQMCMATGPNNFVSLWLKARDAFFRTQTKEAVLYHNHIPMPEIDFKVLPAQLVDFLKKEKCPSNETHVFDLSLTCDTVTVATVPPS